MTKILTSHVGSLPRTQETVDFIFAREKEQPFDQAAFDGQMEAITFGATDNLYLSLESESGNDTQYIYHLKINEYL